MAYEKIDWINDQTALSAENLDRMDQKIYELSEHTINIDGTLEEHGEAIKDLNRDRKSVV